MPTLPRLAPVVVLIVAVMLAGAALFWIGWPDASRGVEFAALMLATVATGLPPLRSSQRDWPVLRLSFVVEFATLMLFGVNPTMVVAACGIGVRELTDDRPRHAWQRLFKATTIMGSLQATGWVYRALGGTFGDFDFPAQAWPIAAGVFTYCVVTSLASDIIEPLLARTALKGWTTSAGNAALKDAPAGADVVQPFRAAVYVVQPVRAAAWPGRVLRESAVYFIGASVAVGSAAMVVERRWDVLAVAAVPLYLAWRLYRNHVTELEQENLRGESIESLHDGVCIVDRDGAVTVWNDALERLLECSRDRAIGRTLAMAVPALASTELPRALEDVATNRLGRTLSQLSVRASRDRRVLQVKLVPVRDGVSLLWQDVTEQTRVLETLQRQGERLALAAEIANDGLWEWDLVTERLYVTGRWKAMIGLPEDAPIGKPEQWFERVHADDLGPLKEALEAHLSGKTERFQHEHRIRHEDGHYRFFQCRGAAARAARGRATHIAGSLTDTTDLAITQERLRHAVYRDPLTGLYNRAVFVEGLGRRLKESQRRRGSDPFALLYLDLDRFKVVNDSLGHLVGDELLVAVSRRLEACLRQGDVLARLGGDEFAILLNGLQTEQQANVIAFRVQEALCKPFSIGGREVFTSASIGIAFGVAQYNSPDEMMHDADTAMYQAKAKGKARHEVFDADMDARARDRLGLENDLRHAVNSNAFETHYQPIVSLASGMCVGFESLVRWNRNGKPVPPSTFIPICEEIGLIDALGTFVLEQACKTFAAWQRQYPDAGLDCITVNVSSRQLVQQNFVSVVERAVRQAGLKPSALRLEITETALMTSPDEAAKVLSQLRDFGVKIYLDDFGTGYSSLSHLHKLPVDALKIDRSFVRSLMLPDRPAIVESILALARTLHTSVVAEGIESDVQARELERLGCTHAQGYLFSRPISTESVEKLLMARKPLGPKNLEKVAVC